MCNQPTTTSRGPTSPLPIKLAKITVIVVFFCFAECAAGSCLSYGHACWGAHGKRNGGRTMPVKEVAPMGRDAAASRWFLERLLHNPQDVRFFTDRNLELAASQRAADQQQLFADAQMEADPLKGEEDFRNMPEALLNQENALFDEVYPRQRTDANKIKVARLLDKRSARMV